MDGWPGDRRRQKPEPWPVRSLIARQQSSWSGWGLGPETNAGCRIREPPERNPGPMLGKGKYWRPQRVWQRIPLAAGGVNLASRNGVASFTACRAEAEWPSERHPSSRGNISNAWLGTRGLPPLGRDDVTGRNCWTTSHSASASSAGHASLEENGMSRKEPTKLSLCHNCALCRKQTSYVA